MKQKHVKARVLMDLQRSLDLSYCAKTSFSPSHLWHFRPRLDFPLVYRWTNRRWVTIRVTDYCSVASSPVYLPPFDSWCPDLGLPCGNFFLPVLGTLSTRLLSRSTKSSCSHLSASGFSSVLLKIIRHASHLKKKFDHHQARAVLLTLNST
jgi:hypothetical protein